MQILVRLPPPVPARLAPEPIPLDVVYEDPDVIVLNKSPGIVVHPAAGCYTGTLANALLYHCHDLAGVGGELRPGIVHRLDRDTSGVMVVAKNDRAMHSLCNQFRTRTVHKQYIALAYGVPKPPTGRIDALIGRHLYNRKKMAVREPPKGREPGREPLTGGRRAITEYAVEEAFLLASMIRLTIHTGRTHQIRVHLSHLGHPVIGDPVYGGRRHLARLVELLRTLGMIPAGDPSASPEEAYAIESRPVSRQMLHAETLEFIHPSTHKPMRFQTPLPTDMTNLLAALRHHKTGFPA
jgi:23S rRNA pseudouridine1911/1915/1917 synthase